jgi:6-phosphogluconolactonase (cycloisomerase 2 family)
MRFVVRNALRTTLLAFLATGIAAASASASPSPIVGHVFVNDNTAIANTVAAFDRHADGTLTPVPGSPFQALGAGTGAGIASQGALQEAFGGRYLLAVDAGSNQISVLAVGHDGSLAPVSVAWSGGSDPVSIAVHGSLVYVANASSVSPNYTGFRLGRDGRVHPIPGSTFTLPDGSQPGDVLFNETGAVLAGARVATSEIDSFRVRPSGRLAPAAGSPIAAQGSGPFGSEFRPTNPDQLFVSNAHGGAGNGTVSAFNVGFNGALTSIGKSPFPDDQTAPCWVEISHDGNYLFTVNTASASISRYSIARNGVLTLIGSTPMNDPSGLVPEDARLSPDGTSLWVVDSGLHAISGFAVDGGNLTELSSSPTPAPAGAVPAGIVVN